VINLMPTEMKETLIYARRNLLLTRWVIAVLLGIVGIGAVITAGNLYINQSTKIYATEVQSRRDQLAQLQIEETKKRTEDISTSTKLALQVLSRQVLFSELMTQVGAAMPSGAALQSLSIGKLEGGIDLQAVAADYQTGTQVQVNLQDPSNKIFEKADIISITCSTENRPNDDSDDRYPCQVTIRALFAKNSPFLFTNTQTKEGAGQ
jgi:hypothetical protein